MDHDLRRRQSGRRWTRSWKRSRSRACPPTERPSSRLFARTFFAYRYIIVFWYVLVGRSLVNVDKINQLTHYFVWTFRVILFEHSGFGVPDSCLFICFVWWEAELVHRRKDRQAGSFSVHSLSRSLKLSPSQLYWLLYQIFCSLEDFSFCRFIGRSLLLKQPRSRACPPTERPSSRFYAKS